MSTTICNTPEAHECLVMAQRATESAQWQLAAARVEIDNLRAGIAIRNVVIASVRRLCDRADERESAHIPTRWIREEVGEA